MAFRRFASPIEVKIVNENKWEKIRLSSKRSILSENLNQQASKVLKKEFNPNDYLLSHCTIVSSVDTYGPKNVKLGSIEENGLKINRKYPDYRIKPECDKFINDNNDAWKRAVLLKSYPTFIGADNFQEHLQIPEKSKGKVIDAVARDLGYTVYIDLLIATDRKHRELIDSIISGRTNSLSMGCIIEESTCTKCGNSAKDESELCTCTRYEKGNYFYDEFGKKVRVAELCGSLDLGPTAGVVFNDASWVEVPAFRGAVIRNIVTPKMVDDKVLNKARIILSSSPKVWDDETLDGFIKAASLIKMSMKKEAAPEPESDPEAEAEDTSVEDDMAESDKLEDAAAEEFTSDDSEPGTEPEAEADPETEPEADPDLEADTEDQVGGDGGEEVDLDSDLDVGDFDTESEFSGEPEDLGGDVEEGAEEADKEETKKTLEEGIKGVKDKLVKDIVSDVADAAGKLVSKGEEKPQVSADTNDSIIKTAASVYSGMVKTAARQSNNKPDLFLKRLANINESFGINLDKNIYLAALEAGGTNLHGSVGDYLYTCRSILGRKPSLGEAKALIRIGKLLNEVEG